MTHKPKKNRSKRIPFLDELLSARRFRMTVPLNVEECKAHLFDLRDNSTEVSISVVAGGHREFEIMTRSRSSYRSPFDGFIYARAQGTLRAEEAMGMTRITGYVHLGFWPSTIFVIITLIFLAAVVQSFVNNTLGEWLSTNKVVLVLAYAGVAAAYSNAHNSLHRRILGTFEKRK